jgi:hypothetical protein
MERFTGCRERNAAIAPTPVKFAPLRGSTLASDGRDELLATVKIPLAFAVTAGRVVAIAAAIEAATGAALIADPSVVVRLLIGASLSGGGVPIGRVCGFALLSLGLACRPSRTVVTAHVASALLTYNLLTALYLGYLGVMAGFSGYLLWPACVLHALLALLLVRSRKVPAVWPPAANLTQGARLAEGVESSNPRDDEGHR